MGVRQTWISGLAVFLASSVMFQASATSVLWADMSTLGEKAHLIVTGTVSGAGVVEREAQSFQVFTDYTLTIDAVKKGEPSVSTVTVRIPGGQLADGRKVEVEGMPEFDLGARYLLVLWALDGARYGESEGMTYYVPLGLQQGVWKLTQSGDETLTVRDLGSGAAILMPDGANARHTALEHSTLAQVIEALTPAP